MTTVTAYGGAIYRGTVTDASRVGPANSVSFTMSTEGAFNASLYSGSSATVSLAWILIDTTTGITSSDDFPVLSFSVGDVTTTVAPTVTDLDVKQGALLYYTNLPHSKIFRFANRRGVSITPKLVGTAGLQADSITLANNSAMHNDVNFNVYSAGFQFSDGTAYEYQFINDASGPNIVSSTVHQATDVSNKFAEMADIYIDRANTGTYFNNRVYDDANLMSNLETTFNLVAQKVPNMLDVSDSVTITGTLTVSATGQPVTETVISVSTANQFLDVLFDQSVTVGETTYDPLKSFDFSTASDNDSMNQLRNDFLTSFVQHATHYFDNTAATYPSAEISQFIIEYLKPILKRARYLAMAAITGTDVEPIADNTNSMYLRDSDQPWSSYAALTLNGVLDFEATMSSLHGLANYTRYMDHVQMYERTLTADGTNWADTALLQKPFQHTQKFLAQVQDRTGLTLSSKHLVGLLKLLQVWNIARVHNNLYDNDGDTGQTTTDDGVIVRSAGNNKPYDGKTVCDLQLQIYQQYGYGATYAWLSKAANYLDADSEPTGEDSSYIDQNLLDRVMVHLRLNEFAEDIRPASISDAYEKEGWTAFVDAFMRYYLWSATSAAASGDFSAEQNFIGRKASFFEALDASFTTNTSHTLNQHLLGAMGSVSGVSAVEAQAFVDAMDQVRSVNSGEDYWDAVIQQRLNHLPYHVVWDQTENMTARSLGSAIAQNSSVLISSFNNLVEYYPRTTTADSLANTLVPSVYDWYKAVGYLAAVPQELPSDDSSMYSAEIGFSRSTRANYPFVAGTTNTMGPQVFFNELTRRLYYFHRCDANFVASAALNSTHIQTLSTPFSASIVLGEYDANTDHYTTGFRSWVNVNNYYQLLKKENELRLAISNQNSEYDLEDLARIFTSANTDLDGKLSSLSSTNTAVSGDISSLNNVISTYHDPYLGATTIEELQVRYVQVASENRAQAALKATYTTMGALVTSVKTSSSTVNSLQFQYQQKLDSYNTSFDDYMNRYQQWNTLLDNASALLEGSTTYIDLIAARIQLVAEVSQLRSKFNADVVQIRSVVQGVQQTFSNLKAQGVRAIPASAASSTTTIADVAYTRRAKSTVQVVDLLQFVPL